MRDPRHQPPSRPSRAGLLHPGPSEFHPNPSGLVHGEEPLTEPDDMVIVASPGHRYEAREVPKDHTGRSTAFRRNGGARSALRPGENPLNQAAGPSSGRPLQVIRGRG